MEGKDQCLHMNRFQLLLKGMENWSSVQTGTARSMIFSQFWDKLKKPKVVTAWNRAERFKAQKKHVASNWFSKKQLSKNQS